VETAQILQIASGLEAVERVENVICPDAVTREPAVAEGLALAGTRAASLAEGPLTEAARAFSAPGASCVHHVNGALGNPRAGAFELAAASAQQAVDHCLVAHLLSRRLGRPGVCSLSSPLAEDLSTVELPGPDLVASLFEGVPADREPDVGSDRVLELAAEAARAVAERTQRPGDLVEYGGEADAELALVGSGAGAAAAREAARVLSAAGISAASVAVNLLRPFPEVAVRDALARARNVFVVDEPTQGDALLARVRAALGAGARVELLPVAAPEALLGALVKRLPQADFDPQQAAVSAEQPSGRLLVAPAGLWAERTLREVAGALTQLGALRVTRRTRAECGASLLGWDGEAIAAGSRDLLLASHPTLLDSAGALSQLRAGATAIVLSTADSSEELARLLGADTRDALRSREIRVCWLPAPRLEEAKPGDEADRAASLALAGATLVTLREGDKGAEALNLVANRLRAVGRTAAARWLREGADRVRVLDPAELDPSRHIEELDFRPPVALPKMPEAADDGAARESWAEAIRRFHRTGTAGPSLAPGPFAWPAALGCLRETLGESSPHPFALVPSEDAEHPVRARGLRGLLAEGIERLQGEGSGARTLSDNRERLASLMAKLLAQGALATNLADLLAEGGGLLASELDLPGDERQNLVADLESLAGLLPADAAVFDVRKETPLRLYLEVRKATQARLQRLFQAELEQLAEQLRDLLALDFLGSSAGRAPEAVAVTLGDSGLDLDMQAFSNVLSSRQRSEGLAPERRQRVEQALAIIAGHLERQDETPNAIFLRSPNADLELPEQQTWEHPDPLAAAIGVFDGVARRLAPLFRAVRIARLEAADEYRHELHDRVLGELSWEGFTAGELALVPAVVVATSGRQLRQRDGRSLSELLCSSRPVHVLIQDEIAAADEVRDVSRFHMDLGYLLMAHREAFAVGSSLARPDRVVEGLVRMGRALRPAAALLQLPAQEPDAWHPLRVEAALQGRACPDFRYDPDAGSSWAERFDLEGNPQPENPWPLYALTHLDDGTEKTLEVALTFADTMALETAYQRQLWAVPPAAWDDDLQLPLAEYLERIDPEGRERWIPYLWIVDGEGVLQRAVVTRELAMVCRDRLRAWRVLQELGGYANVFAERAAAQAREEALAEAARERAALEEAHAEALERVGSEAAQESMERLAAVLMNPEGMAAAPVPSARPAEAPPAEEAVEAEPAAVEEAPEEEEALGFDELYIDTPLCTTCNECTNINAQVFQYNAEKQAFVADAGAGSYAELVKAAELCPARCIHPGKPRSDDPTVTPELIERAAPFK
jgi:ferredoxin